MAAQPPAPGSFPGKLVLLAVALGPPALVGAGLWVQVRTYPLPAAGLLLLWWLLVAAGRFATRVGGEVSALWAPRLAGVVDRAVTSRTSYRRRYIGGLTWLLRFVDLEGVPTQGEYTLRLQDVYVDVSLVPRPLHGLSQEPYLGATNPPAPGERVSLRRFLSGDEPVVLAVVAGPGSGKTTLLRRTALERCRLRRGLPVLLLLRDHVKAIAADPKVPLSAVIASEPWLHGAVPASWFERWLGRGRCLILLDGLDEVASEEHRKRVVTWAQAQIARYPRNDFVITSRPYGYESNPLNGASVLSVRRFTPAQVARFVHGWYAAVEERSTGERGPHVEERASKAAGELLDRLRGQASLHDLAANPLLLTMIVNVHRYRGALPGSRVELYGEMCQVLLYRRREAKGVTTDIELKGVQRERVLREVALRMMRGQARDLTSEQLHRIVGPALARVAAQVDAESFIEEVARTGLLVERESGLYAFAHLTLQEYLAAARLREGDEDAAGVLGGHVDDPWWRETTLLWAAGSDVSPVVAACLRTGGVRALTLAFDCRDEAAELSKGLREQLDAMLSDPAPELRRLMSEVAVARALRRVVTIGEDTEVCAVPVPVGLYRRFVVDEAAVGRHRLPDGMRECSPADQPVSGVWDVDLEPFLAWVNERSPGVRYRLPTVEECMDATVQLIAGKRPIWGRSEAWRRGRWDEIAGQGAFRLTMPSGVPHLFALTMETLRERWAGDLACAATIYLSALDILLTHKLRFPPDRGPAVISALERIAEFNYQLSRIRTLVRDKNLNRPLMADLDHVGELIGELDLARGHELADRFDMQIDHVLDVDRELATMGLLLHLDTNWRNALRLVVALHELKGRITLHIDSARLASIAKTVQDEDAEIIHAFTQLLSDIHEIDLIKTVPNIEAIKELLSHENHYDITDFLDPQSRLLGPRPHWEPPTAHRTLLNRTMLSNFQTIIRKYRNSRKISEHLAWTTFGNMTRTVTPETMQISQQDNKLLQAVVRREIPLDDAIFSCLRFTGMTNTHTQIGSRGRRVLSWPGCDLAFGITALQLRAEGVIVPDDVIVLVRA